ncbi:MAG TPA: hypothetical protein VNU96_13040 [Burkholderiales bacterium]|jgi:hypothetical protein|nr:hypothetical protein [Burkholderiales bacterium]
MQTRVAFTVLCALLAGCAQQPQTAQEFREAIPGAFMGKVQTFEAKRPLAAVAKTFQARAPDCLNVSVRSVSQSSTSYQNILTVYKATVVNNPQKAELHLQRDFKSGVLVPGKVPPGGLYYVVADATPIDKSRTRIDIYGPSVGTDTLVRAINGWATGENLGCPDMTK